MKKVLGSLKAKLIVGGLALFIVGGSVVWGYAHFQPAEVKAEDKQKVIEPDKTSESLKQTFPEPQVGQTYHPFHDINVPVNDAGLQGVNTTNDQEGTGFGSTGVSGEVSTVKVVEVKSNYVVLESTTEVMRHRTKAEISKELFNLIYQNPNPSVDDVVDNDNMYRATMNQVGQSAKDCEDTGCEYIDKPYKINQGQVFHLNKIAPVDVWTKEKSVFLYDDKGNTIIITPDQFRLMFTANSNPVSNNESNDPETQFAY